VKRFLPLILLLPALRLAAAPQPLPEERLINLDSAHTVGRFKSRFDFQHAFSSGHVGAQRVPVADLAYCFGILPDLQVKVEDAFDNGEVEGGGQSAKQDSSVLEQEVKWRILNQFAGAPVSVSASVLHVFSTYRTRFNGVTTSEGMFTAWSARATAQRDFGRFAQTVTAESVRISYQHPSLTRNPAALRVGERFCFVDARKVRVDAVGDLTVAQRTDKLGFKRAWGAGVQMQVYAPHTFTFYVSNTAASTVPDDLWGYKAVFHAFRWSYRF
jgi:hypothetical protein